MTDHRRLQRTLFRMQLDAGFAARLRAGETTATASTGLAAADLELLLAVPAVAIEADDRGRRRQQFLRNVASEYRLVVAWAEAGAAPDLLADFTAMAHFHEAVVLDLPLPLAFGEHATAVAAAAGDHLLSGLAKLEAAMAHGRRREWPRAAPGPDEIALSARTEVVQVPAGTLDAAVTLRAALDAGHGLPRPACGTGDEHLLLVARPAANPHGLREVGVEYLSPLAGALLHACRQPLGPEGLADFARRHAATAEEVAAFVVGLIAEGVLAEGVLAEGLAARECGDGAPRREGTIGSGGGT